MRNSKTMVLQCIYFYILETLLKNTKHQKVRFNTNESFKIILNVHVRGLDSKIAVFIAIVFIN